MIRIVLVLLFITPFMAMSQVDCNNDNLFYRVEPGDKIPSLGCKIYVVTEKHHRRIIIERDLSDSLNKVNKKIDQVSIEIRKLQEQKNDRQKALIDSMDKIIQAKDVQIDTLKSIAGKSFENTDKALQAAKKYRNISIFTLAGAVVVVLLTLLN